MVYVQKLKKDYNLSLLTSLWISIEAPQQELLNNLFFFTNENILSAIKVASPIINAIEAGSIFLLYNKNIIKNLIL